MIVNSTYKCYQQIRMTEKNNPEVLEISPSFYSAVKNSFISTIIVELCNEFDRCERNLNLYGLLKSISKNIHQMSNPSDYFSINPYLNFNDISEDSISFNGLTEFINYSISEMDSTIDSMERIKKLRNKYYAHLDNDCLKNPERFFLKTGVSYEEIENLLILYSNICLGLFLYLTDTTTHLLLEGYDDYENTYQIIVDYRKNQALELSRIIEEANI